MGFGKRSFVAAAWLAVMASLGGCGKDSKAAPTAPKIGVIDGVAPVDDLQLSFGSVEQTSTVERAIVVVNYGSADLVVGTVGGTSALAAPFSITTDGCSGHTLAPAANCTLMVRFAPTALGLASDTFDVPSNDPAAATTTVTVTGTGVALKVPDLSVTDSTAPANDLQAQFGGVPVGTTTTATVTITNLGGAPLVLGAIANLAPLAAPFAKTADLCSNQTLAPAASCTLTLTFTPATAKAVSDTFEIPSNDPDGVVVTFGVSGRGLPRAPTVTAPTRASGTTSGIHLDGSVAFNGAGKGLAVWTQDSGTSQRILYSYFDGTSWSAQAPLLSDAYAPSLATDGTDFMVVVQRWSQAWALPCTSAGVMGAAARISPTSGGWLNGAPRVVSGGAGNFAVVWAWYESPPGRVRIMANRYAASAWGTGELVDDGASQVYYPAVAANGSAYAVAWQQHNGTAYDLRARIFNGASWGSVATVDAEVTNIDSPKIAANGSGYAVTWRQTVGSYFEVLASVYGGASWSAPSIVDNRNDYVDVPQIASNGTGYAITWSQYDGSTQGIFASLYSGGAWGAPVNLDASTNQAYRPAIASNGAGYAVAWNQYDGTVYRNFAAVYTSSWGTAAAIETGEVKTYTPTVARRGAGYAVVWPQVDGGGSWELFLNGWSGGAWDSAAAITTPVRGSSWSPTMAVNVMGDSVAAWSQTHNGSSYLYVNPHAGGTWGAPFAVPAAPGGSYTYGYGVAAAGREFTLAYCMGGNAFARTYDTASGLGGATQLDLGMSSGCTGGMRVGTNGAGLLAAWMAWDGANSRYRVYAAVHDGATWGPAVPVSAANVNAQSVQGVASNGDGYGLVWLQDNAGYNASASAVFAGGLWSSPALLDGGVGGGTSDGVAIASDGVGYVAAWVQYDGGLGYSGTRRVFTSLFGTGAWGTATQVSEADATDVYSPGIASNGSTYAVAWAGYDATWAMGVHAAVYDTGAWSAPTVVQLANVGVPQLASDGTGYAAVWEDATGPVNIIFASKWAGGTWSTPASIGTPEGRESGPVVASNGAGYVAAWQRYDTVDSIVSEIWAATGF